MRGRGSGGAARADLATGPTSLAAGMRALDLPRFDDDRGSLQEVFRRSWCPWLSVVQWNAVRSEPGVLRGLHVHLGHDELYVVLAGVVVVGWCDVRAGSPTEGATGVLELCAEGRRALAVPAGLCHGVHCPVAATFLVGTTAEWDARNELGCHWRDPAVGIPWPFREARVSARDEALPPLATLRPFVPAWDRR